MWTQRNNYLDELWYRDYDTFTGFGPATKVAAVPDASNPHVIIDAAANVTVTWANAATNEFNVWAIRRPAGGAWGTPVALETTNHLELRTDTYPECQLGVDSRGDVRAVWLYRASATADRYAFSLWAATYSYSAGAWSAARKIAGHDKLSVFGASLATADNGLSVAAYHTGDPLMTADPEAFQIFGLDPALTILSW